MSDKKKTSPKKKEKGKYVTESKKEQYHHGNLKESLVDVALDMVRKNGAASISLRKVAKALGVTQTAPYSHFKDKTSLFAAIATIGFKLFNERMSNEVPENVDDKETLMGLGVGYVLFAIDEPELFRLMFGPEISGYLESEELLSTGSASYELISSAVSQSFDEQKIKKNKQMAATAAWAKVHGFATLIVDGKLDLPAGEEERRKYIREVISL